MTAFTAIEDAVVDMLTAGTPVAEQVSVSDGRPMAVQTADAVAVQVRDTDFEPASQVLGGPLLGTTELVVELARRGPLDQSPAKALSTLLAAVAARFAANPTLNGLAMGCMLANVSFSTAPGETPAHGCKLTWRVLHQVSASTLA